MLPLLKCFFKNICKRLKEKKIKYILQRTTKVFQNKNCIFVFLFFQLFFCTRIQSSHHNLYTMGSISALPPCVTSSPHVQAIAPQHYFLINILPQFDLNIDTLYNICLWEKNQILICKLLFI